MRIAIGSDHAGFDLKEVLKTFLAADGWQVSDLGTHGRAPVDYTDFAEAVGAAVRGGQADRGIILCGSGVGASMAANRIPGVRAGLRHDTYSAHQGVEHDDAPRSRCTPIALRRSTHRRRRAARTDVLADLLLIVYVTF